MGKEARVCQILPSTPNLLPVVPAIHTGAQLSNTASGYNIPVDLGSGYTFESQILSEKSTVKRVYMSWIVYILVPFQPYTFNQTVATVEGRAGMPGGSEGKVYSCFSLSLFATRKSCLIQPTATPYTFPLFVHNL